MISKTNNRSMSNILAWITNQRAARSRRCGTHGALARRAIWRVAVSSPWKSLNQNSTPVKILARSNVALQLSFCLGEVFRKLGVLFLKVFLLFFEPANLLSQQRDMLLLNDRASMFDDELLKLSKNGDVHKSKTCNTPNGQKLSHRRTDAWQTQRFPPN